MNFKCPKCGGILQASIFVPRYYNADPDDGTLDRKEYLEPPDFEIFPDEYLKILIYCENDCDVDLPFSVVANDARTWDNGDLILKRKD